MGLKGDQVIEANAEAIAEINKLITMAQRLNKGDITALLQTPVYIAKETIDFIKNPNAVSEAAKNEHQGVAEKLQMFKAALETARPKTATESQPEPSPSQISPS